MANASFIQTDVSFGTCDATVRFGGSYFPATCSPGVTNVTRLASVSGPAGSTPATIAPGIANGSQSWISLFFTIIPSLTSWPWTTLRVPINVSTGNSLIELVGMAAGRTSNLCAVIETLGGVVLGTYEPLTTGVHTLDIPITTSPTTLTTNRLIIEVCLWNTDNNNQSLSITPDQTILATEPSGIPIIRRRRGHAVVPAALHWAANAVRRAIK